MSRKKSKAVLKGNGPGLHNEFGPDQSTLAGVFRMFEELFDRIKSHFDQQNGELDILMERTKKTRQRLVGLEQDTQQ